eukprot:560799-Rhodomonas_salina.2
MFIVVGVGALAGMVTRTVLSSMGCCLAWRLNNPDSDLDDADLFVAVTAGGEHDQQGDLQARTRQPQEPGLLPTLSSYAHPAFWVCPLRYPPTHTLCCAVVRSARYTILVRSLGLYNTLSSDAHPVQCAVLRKRMVAAHHFRHGAQAREGNGAYEPGQLTLLCPKHERFQLNRAQISPQTSKFLDQLCLGAESWWLTWRGYDLKPALGDSEMSDTEKKRLEEELAKAKHELKKALTDGTALVCDVGGCGCVMCETAGTALSYGVMTDSKQKELSKLMSEKERLSTDLVSTALPI